MERKYLLVTSVQNLGPFLRIFGQLQGDTMKLIQAHIDSAIKESAFRPKFTELSNGQFCLAKNSGGKFSRARVKSLNADFISVCFVDYGTEERIRINEIRLLPPNLPKNEFLKTVQSQLCAYILGGIFADWDDYQLNQISNVACNQLVEIKILLQIPRFCFIKIILNNRCLVDHLINEKRIGKTINLEKQKEVFLQISNKATRSYNSSSGIMSYNHNMMMRPNPREILPPRQLHSVLGPKNMNVVQSSPVTFNHIRMQAPQAGHVMGPRFYGFNNSPVPSIFSPAFPYESYKTKPGRMSFNASTAAAQSHREYKPTSKLGGNASPAKASVATFKSNTLLVGQTYNVTCCIVENGPCLFSVHLETEIEELNTMMNELENETLKNISERPSIGMACIARFSEDGNLYRAVIMSIKPTACQVAYVDYGNTELVSFANLYEIPPTYLKHKIFAIRFALSGYKDLEPIDDSIKNLFKNMVFQKRLTLKVMPLEGPPLVQYCELWDNKINILEALKLYKNKKLTYGPTQPITQNDIVVITFVESPKKFFVQSVKNIPAFDNLMDELFLHCRKSKDMVTRFVKGTACAVKFENAWYRAEVIGEIGSRVHIRHVDFGNERSVDKNQLYAINEKLVEFPPQAVHCCLKGFENADSLSDSATVQLEMLAETSDNERRHFKCNVIDQHLPNGATLVNLIDDTIRPELNLMKRLFRLSMPFNTYIGLEKEMSISATPAHGNVHAQPKSVASAPVNGDHLYVQQQTHQAERSSDWEINSSGSSDIRETAASPSSSQGGRRGQTGSIRGGHKENKQRDNYNSYKTKSTIPPRFQKQKIENKGNKENNQQNFYNKQNSSTDSGKFSQTTRSTTRRDVSTSNSNRASSPTPDVIEIHEYLPFDVGLPEQTVLTPSRKDVIVCWWISPHQFYVHQKSRIPDFENMMKRIQAFYKTIPATEITPNIGSHIIARYKEDKILYRARVLACNATLGKYRVLFVDFGNQSTCDASDIWAMEKRFSVLPIMCQLCSFDGVVANYDHKYITSRVEKYLTPKANLICNFQRKENELYFVDIDVNGKSLKESLISDGTLSPIEKDVEVELLLGQQIKAKIISVKDLLNFQIEIEGCDLKLMCSYNDIKLIRSNPHLSSDFKLGYEEKVCVIDVVDVSKEKILMLQPIIPLFTHDIPPKVSDYPIVARSFNVKVSYIKNENILFVSPSALENVVYELVDNMFNHYEEGGQLMDNIKVGDVCAAKSSDENWYRARVIAASKKKESYEVFYIDYGNTEIITEANRLKKLEEKFCDLSALSIRVYLPLKSIKEHDEAVIKEIRSLTDGCELNLKVVELYKKRWIVDILSEDYSLVDYLTDKSLIRGKDFDYVKNIIDNEKSLIDVTLKDSVRDLSKSLEIPSKTTEVLPTEEDDIEEAGEGVALADAKDIKSYSEEYDDSMENMTEAYLSHCDNPGRFFLQLASNYTELTKLQDNLQIVAGSLPLLTTYTDGALCIALYSVDETWYRAKIIDSEIMVIQFIDYGNTDVITDNSYIKEMNEAFAHIEPFAIQCALPIAPKDTVDWVDEANNVFNEIYDKSVYFDYITQGEQKSYVHLKVEGADISEKLIKNNMARPLEILPSGENCFVSHINNLSDFYVQMECDSNGLELIADHLAGYETFPLEDEYKVGTICAAIFPDDSEWYRAKILSREKDETNVFFIDYGNTSITPEARKISQEIANLPFLSKKCSLRMPDYILGWSDAAEAKFTELSAMGQTVFTIKLVEPGDHAVVDLYIEDRNILDELEKLCDKRPQPTGREAGKTPKKEKVEERVRKEICVSHVNSPLEFYVQLEDEGTEVETITNDLASAGEYKKLEKHEADTICAAIYPVDGAYYRARILSQDNRGTQVIFIDFGNTAISKDLRILPDALRAKKPYARLCSLDDQDIDFTTQEAIDIFNGLLGDGTSMECEVTREVQSLWIVKLYKDKKDLAVELARELKEKNTPKEEEEPEKKTEESETTNEQVETVELESINVMVSHVNSHTDFYVQLESEDDTLDMMLDELAKAEEFEKFENYSVGDLCAAVFVDDGAFYRAKIISKSAEDCDVLFIDYGNSAPSSDIRKLPKHLVDIAALAKHCTLEKNADYDENVELSNEHFSSLVTSHFGETFQVKILKKESDQWTIQLFYNNLNISSELAKLVKEAEQSKSEEEVWSTLKDQSKASSEIDTSAALEEEAVTEFVEGSPAKIPTDKPTEKTAEPTANVLTSSHAEQKTETAKEPKVKSSTEVAVKKVAAEDNSEVESSTDTATEGTANVTTESLHETSNKENDSKNNTQEFKTERSSGLGESKLQSQWSDTRDANESFNEDVVIAVIEPSDGNPPADFSVENGSKNLSSEELGNSLWAGLHSLGIADRAVSASETNLSNRTNETKTDASSATNLNIPNSEDVSKSCINLH